MFELSENENVEEEEEPILEKETECLAISKQGADALFGQVGEEVEDEEDQINFETYSNMFSDSVHKHLMELLEELHLPYELAEFQKVALHSIGSGKNTILISPTGSDKSLVVNVGILLLRKIKQKPRGVAIGTLPLSIIMQEKVKTSSTATAVISLSEQIEFDESKCDNFSASFCCARRCLPSDSRPSRGLDIILQSKSCH